MNFVHESSPHCHRTIFSSLLLHLSAFPSFLFRLFFVYHHRSLQIFSISSSVSCLFLISYSKDLLLMLNRAA